MNEEGVQLMISADMLHQVIKDCLQFVQYKIELDTLEALDKGKYLH